MSQRLPPLIPSPLLQHSARPSVQVKAPRRARMPAGFTYPRVDLVVPGRALGRVPGTEVEVRRGFDGRTPGEVLDTVSSKAKGSRVIDAAMEKQIRATHHAFTVTVNNAFVEGSPVRQQLSRLVGEIAILGTLSPELPVLLELRAEGTGPSLLTQTLDGTFERRTAPPSPVIMRADLWRLTGVKISHPEWSLPAARGS